MSKNLKTGVPGYKILIILLIALYLLGFGIYESYQTITLSINGTEIDARIINYETNTGYRPSHGDSYNPIVEFVDYDGEIHNKGIIMALREKPTIGSYIPVVYTKQFSTILVASTNTLYLFFVPPIMISIGLILLFVFRINYKKANLH